MVSALVELERSNVIHRDIKPANILIDGHDCVLADFGLMTYHQEYISLASEDTQFTRHYPAPEFASKYNNNIDKLTTRANVFQLGLVLAELFTGNNPSEGTELSDQMEYLETSDLSDINGANEHADDIRAILNRMLEENPDTRPSASDVVYEWEPILESVTDIDDMRSKLRV